MAAREEAVKGQPWVAAVDIQAMKKQPEGWSSLAAGRPRPAVAKLEVTRSRLRLME